MLKRLSILFISLSSLICCAEEKVLIISHHFAQPFFIELQAKTFERFIKDKYEFVVFNDAKDPQIREEIDQLCLKYNIKSIPISQEIHDRPYLFRYEGEDKNHPCCRCANVVQYSLDVLGFDYPGLVVIIDSDMFLIRPFSFLEFMQGYDLAGYWQKRGKVEYIWNGLVMFNMNSLPDKRTINFNCGRIEEEQESVDVGGYTYYYLSKFRSSLKIRWIDAIHSAKVIDEYNNCNLPTSFDQIIPLVQMDAALNVEFLSKGSFLHYRGGGKWEYRSEEYYAMKNSCITKFINSILEEK